MNTVNRIVSIVVFVLLLLILVALALAPNDVISWVQMQLSDLSATISRQQVIDTTNYNIARVAVVVAALLVLLPLIMAEFSSPTESVARVRTADGEARVTTDSIARRLAWHIDQLADVITVAPEVQARGDHVDIILDIETSPEIDIPMKTEEIMLVTREVVEDRMGLKVGKIDVRLRHSAYPEMI
ncbi:MAG: hypothetical protein GY759_03890 [Chloroflexi bacterium]|nr:hypothetical protein [Chloroflexota bacterium]